MQNHLRVIICLAGVLSTAPCYRATVSDDFRRAAQLEKSGQFEAAIAAYREAVKATPASPQAYAGLGRAYFRLEKYPDAAESFEKSLQLGPDNVEIMTWLGRCYLQDRHPEKVFELIRRVGAQSAQSAKAHLLLARAYEAQEKLKEARQEIREALQRDPSCRGAHFAAGFIDWSLGDSAAAVEELQQEVALDPSGILPSYYLAEALESQGDFPGAESVIAKMGQSNPNAYLYHFSRGKLLERQQKYLDASESFVKAIQVDPTKPDAHYHLAVILRRRGETARSNEEFKIFTGLQTQKHCPTGQGMGRIRPHLPDFE